MVEAYENLNSYRGLTVIDDDISDEEELMLNQALCAVFYGKEIGKHAWEYPPTPENAYYNIVADACSPLKIIFAYDGVKTEEQLRASVLKIVDSAFGKSGYQPSNFPDLIICNNNSIVKTNGLPFGIPFLIDDTWPFYCSSDSNPIFFLLEMIWHRLDFLYGLSKDLFEPGIFWNQMSFFLGAQFVKNVDKEGWLIVNYPLGTSPRDLFANEKDPVELNYVEFVTLGRLLEEKTIDVQADEKLRGYFKKEWVDYSIFAQQLANKGLIHIHDTTISLVSDKCVLMITDNGRFFGADPAKQDVDKWLSGK